MDSLTPSSNGRLRNNEGDGSFELNKDPTPADVAEVFLKRYMDCGIATLRSYRREFYVYDGAAYRKLDRDELKAQLNRFLRQHPITRSWAGGRRVDHVIEVLLADILLSSSQNPPFWLNGRRRYSRLITMGNGILDIKKALAGTEDALLQHTPEHFDLVEIQFDYDPAAQCPVWINFLEQTHSDPFVRANIQEFFGYCLDPRLELQRCMILEGQGRNGKKVISETLINMLGRDNVSAVGLEKFGSPFGLFSTLNKLANIVPDLEEIDKVAEGTFKSFVAQDEMQFERKFKDSFMAKPTAKMLISTNHLPRFRDRTAGVWRRLLLIKCLFQVAPEAADPTLIVRIKRELPGVFNWALQGLSRLYEGGDFTPCPLIEGWVNEYRIEQNPANEFLTRNYVPDPAGVVFIDSVFAEYREYCHSSGTHPLNKVNFGKEIRRVFPRTERGERVEDGKRQSVYMGLRVKA